MVNEIENGSHRFLLGGVSAALLIRKYRWKEFENLTVRGKGNNLEDD